MIAYVFYEGVRLPRRDYKGPDHVGKVGHYKPIIVAQVLLQMK
jgi:hypothetical protein